MKQADKRPAITTFLKYSLYCILSFAAFRIFNLIPGSSPLKYVASVITVIAVIHSVWSERRKAKEKKEDYSIPADKWFLFASLLVAFGAGIHDDVNKYATDQASQKKSDKLAKAQTDLALTNNKLALTTNENTHKAAADAAKTRADAAKARAYAAQTRTDATRIRQDDAVIVLSQQVLTALAHQNNKMARQNALEQKRAMGQQTRDAKLSRSVTEEQAARIRDTERGIALHNDVKQAARSVHSLKETLYGLERTLSPIQSVRVSYVLKIPLDSQNPQMQAYKKMLDEELENYQKSLPTNQASLLFTPQGGSFLENDLRTDSTERLIITRGSKLYPTDKSSVLGSAFSYPVKIGFWHRSAVVKMPNGSYETSTIQPDMELDNPSISEPVLAYYPTIKELRLLYTSIAVTVDMPTGKIVSRPDLDGALIVVKPNDYDSINGTFHELQANGIQRQCKIIRIGISIASHTDWFETGSMFYQTDPAHWITASFIFDSQQSLRNNSSNPIF